jgi:hypothetical protein
MNLHDPSHYDDRPLRYDDEYAGARWTYGLTYRPLSSSNVPRDWILFSDRPHPDFRHGTVQYSRQLTSGEVAAFQLTPLVVDEASCDWCSELAPLREWTHEGGELEDLCPRCYRAAEEQQARERSLSHDHETAPLGV